MPQISPNQVESTHNISHNHCSKVGKLLCWKKQIKSLRAQFSRLDGSFKHDYIFTSFKHDDIFTNIPGLVMLKWRVKQNWAQLEDVYDNCLSTRHALHVFITI